MKIEKGNVKVEVNKPTVHFNEDIFTENEVNISKKKKRLLIATTALTIGAAAVSKVLKGKKKNKQ